MAETVALLQTDLLEGDVTEGGGFTVMVNVVGASVAQPFAEGVTEIVDVTGVAPVFVPVNAGTLSVPLAAKPMLVVLFVHV